MKKNAIRLTVALFALLLALTCVFAGCTKDEGSTPVNGDSEQKQTATISAADADKIIEAFQKQYEDLYLGVYDAQTAAAIEAEKDATILRIHYAATKEDADKAVEEFVAFLKSQKNYLDLIKELIDEIGEVTLKDDDVENFALVKDYAKALKDLANSTNAEKAALSKKFTDDAELNKKIDDIEDRMEVLEDAKWYAKWYVNEEIEYICKIIDKLGEDDFTFEVPVLYDAYVTEWLFNESPVNADIYGWSGEYRLTAYNDEWDYYGWCKQYDIAFDSDNYNDFVDVEGIAKIEKTIKDWAEKNPAFKAGLAVINETHTLRDVAAAAETAEYYDYEDVIYSDSYDGEAITIDGVKYEYVGVARRACYEVPEDEYQTNYVYVKKDAEQIDPFSEDAVSIHVAYKFDLYDELDKIDDLIDEFNKQISRLTRGDYGEEYIKLYCISGFVTPIETAYKAETKHAIDDIYLTFIGENKLLTTDALDEYDFVTVSFTKKVDKEAFAEQVNDLFKSLKNGKKLKQDMAKAIVEDEDLVPYLYDVIYGTSNVGKVYLTGTKTAAADLKSWTYEYRIADGTKNASKIAIDPDENYVFDAAKADFADNGITISDTVKDQLETYNNWFKHYIGVDAEDYADSYDLQDYADYAECDAEEVPELWIADRAIEQVGTRVVASYELDDKKVEVDAEKETNTKGEYVATVDGVKVISHYNMLQAYNAEFKRLDDAVAAVAADMVAAAKAIGDAGAKDVITPATELMEGFLDGSIAAEALRTEDMDDDEFEELKARVCVSEIFDIIPYEANTGDAEYIESYNVYDAAEQRIDGHDEDADALEALFDRYDIAVYDSDDKVDFSYLTTISVSEYLRNAVEEFLWALLEEDGNFEGVRLPDAQKAIDEAEENLEKLEDFLADLDEIIADAEDEYDYWQAADDAESAYIKADGLAAAEQDLDYLNVFKTLLIDKTVFEGWKETNDEEYAEIAEWFVNFGLEGTSAKGKFFAEAATLFYNEYEYHYIDVRNGTMTDLATLEDALENANTAMIDAIKAVQEDLVDEAYLLTFKGESKEEFAEKRAELATLLKEMTADSYKWNLDIVNLYVEYAGDDGYETAKIGIDLTTLLYQYEFLFRNHDAMWNIYVYADARGKADKLLDEGDSGEFPYEGMFVPQSWVAATAERISKDSYRISTITSLDDDVIDEVLDEYAGLADIIGIETASERTGLTVKELKKAADRW